MEVAIQDLCCPRHSSLVEALQFARAESLEDSSYDLKVSEYLHDYLRSRRVEIEVVERVLEILGEIAPPRRLFATIKSVMSNASPQVAFVIKLIFERYAAQDAAGPRSKPATPVAGDSHRLPWIQKLAADNDDRVRANTIEALWGRSGPEIETIFENAFADLHHRVAANAAYGLYLIEAAKGIPKVEALLQHSQPLRRAAGAWIWGKSVLPTISAY